MKGKSSSQVQFQSKKWVFVPELDFKLEKTGARASSQLSTALQSDAKADSALRHARQLSLPQWETELEDLSYRPEQFVLKRADPLKPSIDLDKVESAAPITSQEGEQLVTDTLAKATQRAHDFIIRSNQPSAIFQRFSSLPPVTPTPQFPKTLEVLKYKETRRQGYKEPSPLALDKKKLKRRVYHSAWYLPPSNWKVVTCSQDTNSKYSLQRAKAPYYFLHTSDKVPRIVPLQFQENVKKFQRMPMMGRFRGHLEDNNLRVPPFLQKVKSEREFPGLSGPDSVTSSDTEA